MKKKKDYSKYFNKPDLGKARKRSKEEANLVYFELKDNMKNIGNNKLYHIKTFGCQGNSADSEIISGILETVGFLNTEKEEEADIILINTCAIRENAEGRVFGELGRLKRYKVKNPDLILGICGCMPQEEKVTNKILEKYQYVDLVFGTHNIHKLPEYIETAYLSKERVIEVWSTEGELVENLPVNRENKTKAWINIMFGCDEFCTYCIVPYTRGKERSRQPEQIIEQIKKLSKEGYKEVTLLGQNVNAYGKDFTSKDYTFANLLTDLNKLDIDRIRYTTSHPRDIDDETIEALALGGNIVEYLHLPVQSGNNEILKRMNRKYTREDYIEKINKIKKAVPGISITTDIIVGFPGETEEQFNDTLSLVEEIGFEGAYSFIFSKREGTPAFNYECDLTEEEKKNRLYKLNKLIKKGYDSGSLRFDDKVVEVLVDGVSKTNKDILAGYTRENKLINFTGDKSLIGEVVNVKVTKANTWSLFGKHVK